MMEVEERDIDKITPYNKNPRRNDSAVEAVAESIKRYGWRQPIVVDSKGVIVAGDTRYKAAKLLELDKVPVVVMRGSKLKIAQYRIADNSTHDLAGWDRSILGEELRLLQQDIPDLTIPGLDIGIIFPDRPVVKELTPYTKMHVLISFDIERLDEVQKILDAFADVEGVEIEKSAN